MEEEVHDGEGWDAAKEILKHASDIEAKAEAIEVRDATAELLQPPPQRNWHFINNTGNRLGMYCIPADRRVVCRFEYSPRGFATGKLRDLERNTDEWRLWGWL